MKKILLIDDAKFIRKVIRGMLEKNGYTVSGEAENGKIGLEMYQARRPDVVLLDIVMPEMDGLECLKELKKIDPKVKVIMCSTVDEPKVVAEIFKQGILDFITKPVSEERLIESLESALNGKGKIQETATMMADMDDDDFSMKDDDFSMSNNEKDDFEIDF